MRNQFILLALLMSALLLTGCRDKVFRSYKANVPVYQSLEDFRRTSFQLEAPRSLERPGKIYIYQNYLFVNEYLHGVHFIDNTNPSAPQNIGFLPVLGNAELAIRNDVLYLDNFIDLLAFDISNKSAPVLVRRVEGVLGFDAYYKLNSFDTQYPMADLNSEKGIVIGWSVEKITVESDLAYTYAPDRNFDSAVSLSEGDGGSGGVGRGGSTARFTIFNDHLYAVGDWSLGVFDLTADLSHVQDLALTRLAETLFPARNHLFIGTTTGMQVYDLSSPGNPVFRSEIVHINSCDPVVVKGDRAYVTLSRDRACQAGQNQLMVIDIASLDEPKVLHTYPLFNPKGLGLDQEKLFICDGSSGLKVFDRTDDANITNSLLAHFSNIQTADVIANPNNQVLLMTAKEGIYQYDYSDATSIVLLSTIPVTQ